MMRKYQHILVAVDGSHQAKDAFIEAVHLAKKDDAALEIISVVPYKYSVGDPAFINDSVKFHMNNAEIELDTLISESDEIGDLKYQKIVIAGDPKRKIVKYAKEKNVDLIVMGATGRGAVEQTLIGSTTSYVVNHALCNTLVLK